MRLSHRVGGARCEGEGRLQTLSADRNEEIRERRVLGLASAISKLQSRVEFIWI